MIDAVDCLVTPAGPIRNKTDESSYAIAVSATHHHHHQEMIQIEGKQTK